MKHQRWLMAGVIAAITLAWPAQTVLAQTSFEHKTIRIVVSVTTGSNADLQTRQFAPFIAKNVPGKPTVIVENRPGAGGQNVRQDNTER